MSGTQQQRWVTFASDDKEAWKCILLSRALRRTLTTRPTVVIVSDNVSREMGRRLQDEVSQLYWVDPSSHSGLPFRSIAKLKSEHLVDVHKTVFLDCNVLPLKNCDELFHLHGVQWINEGKGNGKWAMVITKSRSLAKQEQELVMQVVVEQETGMHGRKATDDGKTGIIGDLEYSWKLDMDSMHPTILPGQDMKMVCFLNGHPHDNLTSLENRGLMEMEVMKLCLMLCPELQLPKLVNGYRPTFELDLPRELNDSIAIVGMACRYPCANNIEEFWSLLEKGLEGIRKVPEGRWTKDKAFIRMDNMTNTEAGFLSCPVDTFDAKFFNTNAADMAYLDPQQRLTLRVVWEALEHAAIDPNTLKGSLTGVFGGWWRNDYKEMLQMLGIVDSDFLRGYMGNALGPLTARISHFFELIGPSFSTESGCSTSIAGVDMACDSLRNDSCNLAIAVGANLLLHPFSPSLMEGVLAPDGRCKTYDSSADGFGRAEGIGVLILKRFPDALADGDRIWGLLRGSAIVQEGPSKSMGTPTVDVEAKAMQLALERSGINPNDVEFLETHGTGTPVGDPIEIAAVAKAYSSPHRQRESPLIIGSVKTNIGHTESVCGIASIQKTVLSMKNELIPKHLHLKTLNAEINLDSIPARLPLDSVPWKKRKGGKPRIAGVNSFGITGAQAHILVQEPPELSDNKRNCSLPFVDSRNVRMLTFSAKTEEAFKAQVQAYSKLLEDEDILLRDIEYTMHTGRPHLNLRGVAIGTTKEELISSLVGLKHKQVPNMGSQICFLFTGQGSQYHGMAKSLYEGNIVFQSNFDWCDSVITKEYGFSLRPALWSEDNQLIKQSLYSQTSIFVIEYCLLRLWESWGIKPDAVLGHSLGEFAASVAAGILTPVDALKLVVTRSKLINALPTSSMLVIAVDVDKTQNLLEKAFAHEKKWLDVAAVNSSSQTVLAGPSEIIKEFKQYCDNNGVKTHILDSSHAFHSRLMDPMLEEYEKVAKEIPYSEARSDCTFISGVEGRVVTKLTANYWVRHTREKVQFTEASNACVREGFGLFLEVGPHPILSALLMANVDEIADVTCIPSMRKNSTSEWITILSALGQLYTLGRTINWKDFQRYSGASKVDLPGYHFEESSYWMAIKDEGSSPFHPLLGGFVPNPSDVKIFKSTVNVHRLPFLKDHALGDKIIFPCVGYVDMCLTGGYAAIMCQEGSYVKPSQPLGIKNFCILTPVCLSEMQSTEFQVVVSKDVEGETVANIYTKIFLEADSVFKWIHNATATFTPSPSPISTADFDLAAIKSRCTHMLRDNFNYRELEEFGFNFGPSLQMVTTGWQDGETNLTSNEWIFPFTTHESPEDLERFIIHPWIVDPMLQTQIIATGLLDEKHVRKRLVVPVSMESYTWWGHSAPSGWIYIKHSDTGNEAHLFDTEGKLMVSMLGTEFMETTLSNILSLIDAQKNPYPSMAEYVWKEKLGPEERRIPDEERGSINLQEFQGQEGPYKQQTEEESQFAQNFNKLAGRYMLKAMKDLGLDKHERISWPQIVEQLSILPCLDKFLCYILVELTEDGWLEKEKVKNRGQSETSFNLKKEFPESSQIKEEIEQLISKMRKSKVGQIDLDCIIPLGSVLSGILKGTQPALPLLYPDSNSKGPAELYYTESVDAVKKFAIGHVDNAIFSRLAGMGAKTVVRILEVGAGVGSTTAHHILHMKEAGVSHFEYTYTDISPAFLPKGEKLFEETGISAKFAILNVEKDPLSQGFIPGHYDVIIASWVLHATKSISESIMNLKTLLKPGGYVLINELVKPHRGVNLLFGGLEGFWRFEDLDIRPWNCELPILLWKQVLEMCGFEDFVSLDGVAGTDALMLAKLKPSSSIFKREIIQVTEKMKTWIVFGDDNIPETNEFNRRLQSVGYSVRIVGRAELNGNMEDKVTSILKSFKLSEVEGICYLWALNNSLSTQEICEPFMCICKYLEKLPIPNASSFKVLTITKGQMCTGPSDFSQNIPVSSPLVAMTNVIANENPDLTCKCVDIDWRISEAFSELFGADLDVMVAYRNGQRCLPRVRPYKVKSTPLLIPKTPRYKLILPPSHLIQDLHFAPAEPEPIGEGEVEVEVKAYALNFLDVFMVTKPDPVFEKYNYLGIDIAGVITAIGQGATKKVGDRVVVVRRKGEAMPSHIVAKDKRTLVIPDDITFAEAATYPMGVITVASCLVDSAKAKAGDVVLIHTASGGVGLFGIQIAQRLGCEVVVTAGNERKRNYLRGLGLKYVFNSRTTEYQHEIRKALGRGVDIVLNSLTGPGFKEATLALCEKGARFIEMSKMNIWTNEDVHKLRHDVYYEVVDVSSHPEPKVQQLTDYLREQLATRIEDRPNPLPYTRFDASEIRDALEFMEKVKHIGKIVLTMPEPQGKGGNERKNFLLNDNSTYLITGGLGGIGLEVTKWMASQGAKTFLLLGRNKPKPEAQDKIDKLRAQGIRIEVRSCDVGNMQDLQSLMKSEFESGSLPTLRGIMHAAGVLDDATFENQSWTKYENVFHCKVKGAWNLHDISRSLAHPLEHFVLFSSMTVTLGSPGQSNYSAANYYLDQLVHYRNSLGLPGTTINWGQWGQVGMAANFHVAMNKPLTIHQGIAALEHVLLSHKIQVLAHETDLPGVKAFLPSVKGPLADIEEDASGHGHNEIDGDEFWREYDSFPDRQERYDVVRKFLKRLIRLTLKMDKNEDIDDHVNFQDMGMDSLMMVEMKNGLQASVGKRVKISINAVKDCKTVAQLSERLVELISGKDEVAAPTEEELKLLVKEDAQLPDEIRVNDLLRYTITPISKVKTVLVIGSTGMLGPYVVRELSQLPQIQKIFCLMQPNPSISPQERFKKVYEKKGLLQDIDMTKIECVAGNIKEKNFGITSESTYTLLQCQVEAVLNLAVKVAFEEIYRKTDDPKSSRIVNVFGMRNVLSFAIETKLKHVFHASTFAAETQVDKDGYFWEDWPNEEEIAMFPNSAYSISKLICDRLAEQAVERGVPCKVFRLPQIGGDSERGGNIQMDSFLMMRCLAYLYVGSMHGVSIPLSLMAVDQCAKLSVELFFNEQTPYDIYNVLNPHLGDEREFDKLAGEFGVPVQVVDSTQFMDKWKQFDSSDEMIQLIRFATSQEQELLKLRDQKMPYYIAWLEGNKNIFYSRKLAKFMPDKYPKCITPSWDVLRNDIKYARDHGIFDRYRIKHNNNNSVK